MFHVLPLTHTQRRPVNRLPRVLRPKREEQKHEHRNLRNKNSNLTFVIIYLVLVVSIGYYIFPVLTICIFSAFGSDSNEQVSQWSQKKKKQKTPAGYLFLFRRSFIALWSSQNQYTQRRTTQNQKSKVHLLIIQI